MTKYLIVNADDLGLSAGVSRGILESHLHGIVTSTTAMINLPQAADAIRQAQQTAPRLGIGLHVTLTYGAPVLPPALVPSLVQPNGHFHSLETFKTHNSWLNAAELRAEIRAQFRRFVQIAGRLPDHLDAHHYAAYLNPDAFDMILRLAAQYRLPLRSAETHMTLEAMQQVFIGRGYPAHIVASLPQAILEIYETNARPQWPDITEREFYHEGANLENLLHILSHLREGITELMCHPGYIDDLPDEGYRTPRLVEKQALVHPAVREVVEREGIRLINFGQLPATANV